MTTKPAPAPARQKREADIAALLEQVHQADEMRAKCKLYIPAPLGRSIEMLVKRAEALKKP